MFITECVTLKYCPEMESNFQLVSVVQYLHHLEDGRSVMITVPALFMTDLASIPRMGRWLFKGHGRYTMAAIVHDWLYARKGIITLPGGKRWEYTRKEADEVFLAALADLGISAASRYTMYSAVRVGGWAAWS